MADLRSLKEQEFERLLSDFARPAQAITSVQHLHGRADSLKRVRKALRSEGAQAFIFGERGVGKTSLAKTAVAEFCPSHAPHLLIACEKDSTFVSIMTSVAKRLLPICSHSASKTELKAAFSKFGFTIEASRIWESIRQIDVSNINSFISFIKAIDAALPLDIAVIIDEFDLVGESGEKAKFAEFVKQLSDQEVRLKFIFCGIADDVDSLIGGHFSAGRYIDPIELGPLKLEAIFAIFQAAVDSFNVELEKEVLIRAGLISDGYPYFMHLIVHHALEILYENTYAPLSITPDIFDQAVRRAVDRAEPMLKTTYDVATKKYNDEYQQVLWAVAAPTVFENKWDDVYDRAYCPFVAPAIKTEPLTKDKFYQRILSLTRPDHGSILTTNKNGWYRFSESVVRSYVRLRASEASVDLGLDMHGHAGKFRRESEADTTLKLSSYTTVFEPPLL